MEGFDDATARFTESAVWPMDGSYPGVLPGRRVHELAGLVRRAIVDKYPLLRLQSL